MNENLKKFSKEALIIALAVVTFVGFGMPSIMYLNASAGNSSSASYAAVASGGEVVTGISGTGTTSDPYVVKTASGNTNYDAGMTFTWVETQNASTVSHDCTLAEAKAKIAAGSKVYVYDQYFAPTDSSKVFVSSGKLKLNSAKYRIGYYITAGGVDGNLTSIGKTGALSLGNAVVGGTVTTKDNGNTTVVDGLAIDSTSDNLNGIIVNGTDSSNTTVAKINNASINMDSKADGSDTNDFVAWGAGLSAFNNASMIVNNATITTTGVARCAVQVDSGADALVKNSTLKVNGGTLYSGYKNTADQDVMVSPPWVLGITGNARATNLMGDNSTATYYNDSVYAKHWGVLSTDSGSNVVLNAINTKISMDTTGNDLTEDSGYGTYAIGAATENFYGSTFNVPTYAVICANGSNVLNFKSSKGNIQTKKYSKDDSEYVNGKYSFTDSEVADKYTTVNSEQFGIDMWGGATVNVTDGTTFNTGNATFLAKSGPSFTGTKVNINNAKINSKSGVIYQGIDNEDAAATGIVMGSNGPVFSDAKYTESKGWLGLQNKDVYSGKDKNTGNPTEVLNVKNATLKGNIFNGSGYKLQAGKLTVNLGSKAKITGKISATTIKHSTNGGKTQNTTITEDKYYQFGHVVNKAYYNGANSVKVTMAKNSTWKVTGTSIITSLKVAKGAKLQGKVYKNGKKITVKAGKTYTGKLTVKAL
jgi:hypothetical protein